MQMTKVVVVALLGLPLAGCFGVSLPAKPVPEWAASPQAQADEPVSEPRKQRVVRRTAPGQLTAAPSALVTGDISNNQPASQSTSLKPFSPEWRAQQDALDERLRRQMNICNGC